MTAVTLCFGIGLTVVASVRPVVADSPIQAAVPRALRLPATPYRYAEVDLPEHVRELAARFDNTPAENPITDAGATLGRVLFYDVTLSANGTTSCASCHRQEIAFTDDERLSIGFDGRRVGRNSMSLINLRYYARGRFFWDERAESLEAQVLQPIENEIEMGHDLASLVRQLADDPLYPPLFQEAFGDVEVDASRIGQALAQFIRSIVSFDSRFDRGLARAGSVDRPFENFTEEENHGKSLFFGEARCASCHSADPHRAAPHVADPLHFDATQAAFFFVDQPVANGIDVDDFERTDPAVDPGLGGITAREEDFGRFKSSSLRFVELTGPYMHDGRFRTLESVVEHYNWSIRPHVNLDRRLQNLESSGLGRAQSDVDALVAFLKTLTDAKLLTDPRYSDPFVESPGRQSRLTPAAKPPR
ncbi:MAG: cytochrome-c peroxidase [Planctomycetaceae bacterium]|nr:MAG: cytochrome-c peroxidase [Planctomycetaceae bacterium]